MIIRTLPEAEKSQRRIVSPDGNWESTRLLLQSDNMGFSFHITTIYAGAEFRMHYQNHLESVFCMSGEGEVETLDDGVKHPIKAGTIYILDKHDRHILRAFKEMFNPALNGTEVHNSEGAYELAADAITD
jgi:L-ectoine synthase